MKIPKYFLRLQQNLKNAHVETLTGFETIQDRAETIAHLNEQIKSWFYLLCEEKKMYHNMNKNINR